MRIFLPALIAVLCCLVQLADAAQIVTTSSITSLPKAIGWLRGGARPSKKTSSARPSSSKSKRYEEEEEDDDDDDDDSFRRKGGSKSRKTSSSSKGSSKGGKGKKRMEMVPWNDRGYTQKKKKGKGFSIKEKLEQIAKTGTSAYKDIYRRAKVMKSSAFEGILLKATWPGNEPVPAELLTEIIKYSIPAFKYSRSDSDDDPYYMTMHKLWTKMSEKDWRTVTKSLFILHCISRDTSPEACSRFAIAIKDMSKTRNPKKADQKYFDLRHVSELDDNGASYEPFVHAYGAYVIHRAKTFSSKFEELKDISSTTTEKKAIAWLKKAQQSINLGIQCLVDKNERNVITGQAVKVVCNDVRELWKLYCEKVEPFVTGENTYADKKASNDEVSSLIKYQKDKEEEIRSFLSKSSKAFSSLKVKIPTDLPSSTAADKLQSKIEDLTKLSGGYVSSSLDDDEDDEDDEDDNEDEEDEEMPNEDDEEEENEDEEGDDNDADEDDEAASDDDADNDEAEDEEDDQDDNNEDEDDHEEENDQEDANDEEDEDAEEDEVEDEENEDDEDEDEE